MTRRLPEGIMVVHQKILMANEELEYTIHFGSHGPQTKIFYIVEKDVHYLYINN